MGSASSETSSDASSSLPPPPRRSRASTMTLSVSAVSPTRGTVSRMSSPDSSVGSPTDTPTPRPHRSKKRGIQLAFPYAPAVLSDPYKTASEAEPLRSIPLCLIPNDDMRQLPPILHLGWSIDQEKLLEWCDTEGFQRTTTDINGHWVFDYTGTAAGALHYLAQRSGAGTFDPHIQLTCHTREPIIIALTSNYALSDDFDRRRSEIFALGSLLLREGLLTRDSAAARWYIDFKEWQWVTNKPK